MRLLLALVLSLSVMPALAAVTLRISTLYPDGTAVVNALRAAGTDIEQQTEGRVRLRIFPGGSMGDDNAVQRKISIGQLDGALAQGGAFARFYRDSQILNLPLTFRSYEEVDFVRGHLDDKIVQGFADNGWTVFGPVDGGFAYLMSKNTVASVEDLRRQKLWMPANDSGSEKAARVFGVSPIVLSIGAVLTSLQTGAIDTLAAPPIGALTLQWHGRLSTLTEVPLLYTYGLLGIANRSLQRLSDADQAVLKGVLNATFEQLDREARADNLKAYEAIRQSLTLVTPTPEQREEWRSYSVKATEQLVADNEISQQKLDELNHLLQQFRQP